MVSGAEQIELREMEPLPEPLNTLAKDDIARADAFAKCKAHSLLKPAKWERKDTFRIHRLTQMVLRDWMGDEVANYVGYVGRLGIAQFTSNPQYAVEDWPRYRRLAPHARAMASEAKQAIGDDLKFAASFVHETALFLQFSAGDLPLVRTLFAENLAIFEQVYGMESKEYSAALGNLGGVQVQLDNDEDAEQNLKKALEISILVSEDDDPSRAFDHNNLAFFYHVRKRYKESEFEFEQALQILEKAFNGKGELVATSHRNIGSNYSNWAGVVSDEANIANYRMKAKRHKVIGLELTREALGELHFDTAACLQNLAIEISSTGDTEKSLSLQILATAIPIAMHKRGLISPEHPEIHLRIGSLAQLLQILEPSLGDETARKKAIELAEKEIPAVIKAHQEWKDAQDDDASTG